MTFTLKASPTLQDISTLMKSEWGKITNFHSVLNMCNYDLVTPAFVQIILWFFSIASKQNRRGSGDTKVHCAIG